MGADDFGVILILIGMAVFVAALVAMIRPLSRLWMPTRKAATVGLALSLGSCLLGGSLMPPPEKAVAKAGALLLPPRPLSRSGMQKRTPGPEP